MAKKFFFKIDFVLLVLFQRLITQHQIVVAVVAVVVVVAERDYVNARGEVKSNSTTNEMRDLNEPYPSHAHTITNSGVFASSNVALPSRSPFATPPVTQGSVFWPGNIEQVSAEE